MDKKYTISNAVYEIEDYLGGNVIGLEEGEIDHVGLSCKLRSILYKLYAQNIKDLERIKSEIDKEITYYKEY